MKIAIVPATAMLRAQENADGTPRPLCPGP